ncbi:MAG: transketolase [Bacteroidales bacterium]|jgi:transketolase|nr:transketolase [Bacteroidales bacterium]
MANTERIEALQDIAKQVRRDIVRMVYEAQSGHPGGSLGCADFMTALFFEVMDIQPARFSQEGKDEDMFFLSNGHITPVYYSVMAHRGYFPVSELATFRKLHTRLQGHPSNAHQTPGVRIASGSLGQGVSIAAGAAQTKKMNNDPHLVYVLTGDGELEEGQMWEAIMYAGAKKVDNLILTVDYNQKQIDGTTEQVMDLMNLKDKFQSFGWHVLEGAGNDMKTILELLQEAKNQTKKGKPVALLMHTEMGYGVDFMTGTHKWHGTPPNKEQFEKAMEQLPQTLGDY